MTDRDAEQKMKAYADQKLGVRERKMKLVVEGKKLIHDYGKWLSRGTHSCSKSGPMKIQQQRPKHQIFRKWTS